MLQTRTTLNHLIDSIRFDDPTPGLEAEVLKYTERLAKRLLDGREQNEQDAAVAFAIDELQLYITNTLHKGGSLFAGACHTTLKRSLTRYFYQREGKKLNQRRNLVDAKDRQSFAVAIEEPVAAPQSSTIRSKMMVDLLDSCKSDAERKFIKMIASTRPDKLTSAMAKAIEKTGLTEEAARALAYRLLDPSVVANHKRLVAAGK